MTQLNLEISGDLEHFVEAEASARGFASSADYVRAVIEAMRRCKSLDDLETTLVERIEGAPAIELTPQVWSDLQARVRGRLVGSGK